MKNVRTQVGTKCDEVTGTFVEDASVAKRNFTECINQNFTTSVAYRDQIITAIHDLRGYLHAVKSTTMFWKRSNDVDRDRKSTRLNSSHAR